MYIISPWPIKGTKEQTLTGKQGSGTITTYRNEKVSKS